MNLTRVLFILVALLAAACAGEDRSITDPSSASDDLPTTGDTAGTAAGETDTGSGTGETPGPGATGGGQTDTDDTGGDPPKDGEFGAPCAGNSDCDSEFCIESFDGSVCTETCLDNCPKGYNCKSVFNTLPDVVFICVPNINALCQPCLADKQCNGGRCVPFGENDVDFCITKCTEAADCPDGFACGVLADGLGKQFNGCLPVSGSCDCSNANVEDVRTCYASNETGTCAGFQVCEGDQGWSTCSAPAPIDELCDGVDNDCDGLIDEDVGAGGACTATNEHGGCEGFLTCLGKDGPVCSALTPGPEVCDYIDNDCDGETDEDFKSGDIYDDPQHCGECYADCSTAVANAIGTCNGVDFNPPQCVVDQCVSGYYQVNDFLCSPVPGKLCDACETDANCVVVGSKCVPLNDGKFCTVPCSEGDACPLGYSCEEIDAVKVCTPDTGSCSCDGTNLALQKACEKTWQDPDDPAAPAVTCPGTQSCTNGGWSDCQMPEDLCDQVDNDCDGLVDGPWINADGQYFTDVSCGVCGNNCSAAPYPNAAGKCAAGAGAVPGCAMVCDDGFFDVNDNPIDGCECEYTSATDHPDGPDQNCDGVDGEIDNAIFVAKTGSDLNTGGIDDPVLTIQTGVNKASAQGKRDVYVATGVYSESVSLASAVAVYGGYSGDFYARDIVLYETAILGSPPKGGAPGAVNVKNLNGDKAAPTVLDGFSIFGFENKAASGSSYGVWIAGSGGQVRISNNRIFAGSGGNGTPGVQGTSGLTGVDGASGVGAYDIGVGSCSVKHNSAGGAGGKRTCGGVVVNGGNGGTAICPDFDEDSGPPSCPGQPYVQPGTGAEAGQSGQGPAAGGGGEWGHDAYIDRKYGPYSAPAYNCSTNVDNNCSSCLLPPGKNKHGGPGGPGVDGVDGDEGQGCTEIAGSVVNDLWSPGSGANSGAGSDGSGGGGGGTAGGIETNGCAAHYAKYDDIGGSGGGGGSGGCGGTGGTKGKGGGGSFGIFVSWSQAPTSKPAIFSNVIARGNGGVGGNGGPGGTGGAGGSAGNGGASGQSSNPTFCTAGGGKGGPGGHGGHGGGGGGGCGGVSFSIFVSGANGVNDWKLNNTFEAIGDAGDGGLGGASLGSKGADGLEGAGAGTNF